MISKPGLIIKFEGLDADAHTVDMRALGRSLVGLDRIISDGVILLGERRMPYPRERAHLITKAQEPRPGSYEILAFLQEHVDELQLGYKIFTDTGVDLIWDWVSLVLQSFGGRKKEAEPHMESLLQAIRDQLSARDQSEARLVAEISETRRNLFALLSVQARPATEAMALIGSSVRTLAVSTETSEKTIIDEPMAYAAKAKGELEVADLKQMTLATDGWVYHSRVLSVQHPDQPGKFISAKVRDPIAEQEPNAYADAARVKATIVVKAKAAYRAGELVAIYIMDFDRVLGAT